MNNHAACLATITTLRELGRLEPVDEALVTATLSLAQAVDADPGSASLWREYQASLRALREVGGDSGSTDGISELVEAIRSSAQVVHTQD